MWVPLVNKNLIKMYRPFLRIDGLGLHRGPNKTVDTLEQPVSYYLSKGRASPESLRLRFKPALAVASYIAWFRPG